MTEADEHTASAVPITAPAQSSVPTPVPAPTSAERDAAYIEFVTSRLPWLRRVAFLLCRDWHRADDLVQTTVTKLYASWPRAEKLGNLDGYTRKILVNTFLAEQRSPWWKRVTSHGAAGDLAPDDVSGPAQGPDVSSAPFARSESGASDLESVLDLRAALARLPPRQRATLVLRYYDQLSVIETAQALGCSTGNVKSQTSRALATLRRRLGAPEPGRDEDAPEAPDPSSPPPRSARPDLMIEHARMGGVKP